MGYKETQTVTKPNYADGVLLVCLSRCYCRYRRVEEPEIHNTTEVLESVSDESANIEHPQDHLTSEVEQIDTREDLISFINNLVCDLKCFPSSLENNRLDLFLEALAAWIRAMDGYYLNMGEPLPKDINWRVIGQMLLAAKYYE